MNEAERDELLIRMDERMRTTGQIVVKMRDEDLPAIREDMTEGLKEQGGRIGKLENWRAYLVGIVAGVGFIVGAIAKWG